MSGEAPDRASRDRGSAVAAAEPGGFFTIYKKGQGYWTRMGTALGSALIGALFVYNFYQLLPRWELGPQTITIVSLVFAAVWAGLTFYLMNKPTNADFLISTDSEMKKVNWTSRKELIGSTKVVVIFMLMIALILFLIDTFFGYLFYIIKVLKFTPFGS